MIWYDCKASTQWVRLGENTSMTLLNIFASNRSIECLWHGLPISLSRRTVTVFFVLDVFFKNHFHISCIPSFSLFKSRRPRFSLYSMVQAVIIIVLPPLLVLELSTDGLKKEKSKKKVRQWIQKRRKKEVTNNDKRKWKRGHHHHDHQRHQENSKSCCFLSLQ